MDDDAISEKSDHIQVDVDEIEINSDTDEEEIHNLIELNIQNNIEDINVFNKNYESFKKNNITNIYLNKYEITKILSKRSEQLESGCIPLIENYEKYNNVYDMLWKNYNYIKYLLY